MEDKIIYFKSIAESIEVAKKEGPIPFIWGGIKVGSYGYVFGPSKSGKTTFCENFAMSLVCGKKEFLGKPLIEENPIVLFVSLEEYERPRSERNDKQLQFIKAPDDLKRNLLVIDDEFPKFILEEKEYKILYETIIDSKAVIVFIDSLTRMSPGDIEKSDTARRISATLKKITYEAGITMIVIHHSPKLNDRMLSIDSLAGSHVIAQEADFLIGIHKYNGIRYIKEVASRYKREEDEKVLTFTINDDMWIEPQKYIVESSLFKYTDRRIDDSNSVLLFNTIKDLALMKGDPAFTTNELYPMVESFMGRSTFFVKIKEHEQMGNISQTGKGEYIFNGFSST